MDDLAGLDWKADCTLSTKPSSVQYSTFQSTPPLSLSRQSTPISTQQSGNANSKSSNTSRASAAVNDSFSNLLAPKPTKTNGSVSLQERQRLLLEEKARQLVQEQQQYEIDAQHWEGLGSGRGTPAPAPTPSPDPISQAKRNPLPSNTNDDEDILSAFNSSAPVDSSSHFPPPRLKTKDEALFQATEQSLEHPGPPMMPLEANNFDDDDDPFGLSQIPQKPVPPALASQSSGAVEDDNILGALGKPVSSRPAPAKSNRSNPPESVNISPQNSGQGHPADASVAELVEMGFPVEKAREALEHTETGVDVQAAVGWLLNRAHQESKGKVNPHGANGLNAQSTSKQRQERDLRNSAPAWARQNDTETRPPASSRSSSSGEKDVKQYAAEISTTFFKSANSLWKTGQQRVQRVVAEYKQEGDPSQPKWMREVPASELSATTARQTSDIANTARRQPPIKEVDVTDEALMLESGRSPTRSRPLRNQQKDVQQSEDQSSRTRQRPALPELSAKSRRAPAAHAQDLPPRRPVEKLSRQASEEQSGQAYVSPARRRKPPLSGQSDTAPTSLDIFSAVPVPSRNTVDVLRDERTSKSTKTPAQTQIRPKAIARSYTQISPSILSSSNSSRQKGTEAFKRGDYAEAHSHYSQALTPLPDNHPVAIIVRCNRALTNIKVGDPKAAIIDTDAALSVIGPSHGEGESIALGGAEADKDMKEFFGKALMRKAEALENMEKWPEAAKIWREAVQAGVGGAISIQGRNRCERASGSSGPAQKSTSASSAPKKTSVPKPPATKSAFNDLNGSMNPGAETEAVKRLRAANAAADAASDEAFALSDLVEARLTAWKSGKADNLRALLASLDTVLWPEAGWTKVGMGDLVLPPRAKIVYMKAIAKVHPDKLSQNATTEQKMVSASVFATLNEAWDSFKRDNGL